MNEMKLPFLVICYPSSAMACEARERSCMYCDLCSVFSPAMLLCEPVKSGISLRPKITLARNAWLSIHLYQTFYYRKNLGMLFERGLILGKRVSDLFFMSWPANILHWVYSSSSSPCSFEERKLMRTIPRHFLSHAIIVTTLIVFSMAPI